MKRTQSMLASSSAGKEFEESDTVLPKKFKSLPCNYPVAANLLKKPDVPSFSIHPDSPLSTATKASNDLTKGSNEVVLSETSVSCCSFLQTIDPCSSTFIQENSNSQNNKQPKLVSNLLSKSFLNDPVLFNHEGTVLKISPCFVDLSKNNDCFNNFLQKPGNPQQFCPNRYKATWKLDNQNNVNPVSLGCESVHADFSNEVQNISSKIENESSKDNVFPPINPCSSTFIQEHSNSQNNKQPKLVSNLLSKSFPNDPVLFNHKGTVLKIFPCFVDLSKNNDNDGQKPGNPQQFCPNRYEATWKRVQLSTRSESLLKKDSTFDPHALVRKIYVKAKLNNTTCNWKKVYNTYFNSYQHLINYDAFLNLMKLTISRHNMCIKMDNLRSRLKKITDNKEVELRSKKKICYGTFGCIYADEKDYKTHETCVRNMDSCEVRLFDCYKKRYLLSKKDRLAITSCSFKYETAISIKAKIYF